jgi:PAS domain S-box-containing protein
MGSLTSKAPGGVMARYLLPVAISLPAILGWLSLLGQRYGFYNAAEGVALLASASLLVFGLLVWAAARLLNRLDARRSGAETALRESEARFRLLADAMPTIVWSVLPDGSLDYCNRHWLEYTGLTFEQSLALGWTAAVHPDDLPQVLAGWKQSLETGEPREAEYRFRRAADDSYRWHLGRAVPARNSSGAIIRWFGSCTDIEDYKRAEAEIRSLNEKLEIRVQERTAELAATEARLRGVLEAATQVAIIAVDTNRIIRIFNPGAERMLGYRAEEVVGRYSPDHFHDHAECEARATELTAEFGHPVSTEEAFLIWARHGRAEEREWSYIRKDGTRLRVRLAVTPLRGPDGGIQGFLGVATDITSHIALEAELRQANARLIEQTHRAEEANRAKTRFLAAMSHEIRTPMNAILGMADVLWDTPLDSEQRQYVEVFRHAGGLLMNLINDLLDLSKIESVGVHLEQIDFDLETLIDECVELSAPRAREKSLRLLARIVPGTQTALRGDPSRLRQVLLNLLGNALKFTAEGQITLTASNHSSGVPGHIEIAVADTGIGIPRDRLGAIFEEFEQADTSTTRRYGGTGLGLSISRLLVQKMGGSIGVESQVGLGTNLRFDVLLEVAATALPRESDPALAGRRALVVAPDPAFRQVLVEALESFGMTCGSDLPGDYGFALIGGLPGDLPALARLAASGVPLILAAADGAAAQAVESSRIPLAGRVMLPVSRRALRKVVCEAMALRPSRIPVQGSNTPHPPPPGAPLRILIAEDAAGNRFLLQAFLKDTPHRAVFAEHGGQAVEYFKQGPFDIIFMDMQMPVMDGLETVAAIRDLECRQGRARTPVIALTASAYAEDVEAAQRAGCDWHLAKPVSKSTFLETLAAFTASVSTQAASAGGETPDSARKAS